MASCDPTSNKLLVTYLQIDNHIGILSGKQNKTKKSMLIIPTYLTNDLKLPIKKSKQYFMCIFRIASQIAL